MKRATRPRRSAQADIQGLDPDPDHPWRHDNIGRLFVFAFHAFEERLLQRIHAEGHREIKHVHLNLFRNVDLARGTRIVDLARRVGITKAAMGQLAREGEALGLFTITQDANDGRAKIVRFTRRGKAVHGCVRKQILGLEREFAATLGKRRYNALRAHLLYLRAELMLNSRIESAASAK